MRIINKLSWMVTGLQLVVLTAGAQQQKVKAPPAPVYHAKIKLIAKAYGDSVVLRWGPTTAWAWSSLNYTGYRIERTDLSDAGHPKKEVLTVQPLKPLTLEQFKSRFGRDNKYAAIAAQCLYGKNFASNLRKGPGGIADQASVFNSRFSYLLQVCDYDAGVAVAAGLRFSDKNVQKKGVYIYRVFPAGATQPGPVDTASALVSNTVNPVHSRPKLAQVVAGDRKVELQWGRAQEEKYSGYYIERSGDGRNFKSLTSSPFFAARPDSGLLKGDSNKAKMFALLQEKVVYIDSLPLNYHSYSFRIRGVNAFAEWSDYSDTLVVAGRDLTPPEPPTILNPVFLGGRNMKVLWKKTVMEKDLAGYYISRAKDINGPYIALSNTMVLPGNTTFTDTAAFPHGQNYYLVTAIDTAGNTGSSLPAMGLVPDNTPPAAPTGLQGRIDRNGLVHLSWRRNTEEDAKGYKVYFANNPKHVYSQITLKEEADTAFVDTISLKTLTKYIWYKVVAVDENNNHSAFSEALRLKKPDIVPPVPPLAKKVIVDSSVQIDFIKSASEDVVRYIVFRKKEKGDWQPVQVIQEDRHREGFHFSDNAVEPFVPYQYCAEAVDEDSLHSGKSTAMSAMLKTVPELPAITTLTAWFDDPSKTVRLSWQYPGSGGVGAGGRGAAAGVSGGGDYFFLLYKADADGAPLRKYHSIPSGQSAYTDTRPGSGGAVTTRYAIQVIYKDTGRRTRVSSPVAVMQRSNP